MSDVEINLGTHGSRIEGSSVTVGDVAGGSIEKRLADYYWKELDEIKTRLKAIESFLAGSPLGEPGMTEQVRELKTEVRRLEKEIELIVTLDARLDRQEEILKRYEPLWLSMQQTYGSTRTVGAQTFNLILALLIVMAAVMVLVLFTSR